MLKHTLVGSEGALAWTCPNAEVQPYGLMKTNLLSCLSKKALVCLRLTIRKTSPLAPTCMKTDTVQAGLHVELRKAFFEEKKEVALLNSKQDYVLTRT